MKVILGAGGTIGRNISKILTENNERHKLVSRTNPLQSQNWEFANLLNASDLDNVLKGAETAFLTAGLKYKSSIWQEEWPVIMQNVIEACKRNNVKLIFFDNVYAYGKVKGEMTEDTSFNPCSKKGETRAKIAETLLHEIKQGNIKALIARSADFYGPQTPMSILNMMVLDRIKNKQKAQWVLSADKIHSFTYTPDAALGCYLLSKDESSYGATWHLPTFNEAITVREIAAIASTFSNSKEGVTVLPKWMFKALGTFNSDIKESLEMLYQYEDDYIFSSKKFEEKFKFLPTSYKRGIVNTLVSA